MVSFGGWSKGVVVTVGREFYWFDLRKTIFGSLKLTKGKWRDFHNKEDLVSVELIEGKEVVTYVNFGYEIEVYR